jgi:hypothetical protein
LTDVQPRKESFSLSLQQLNVQSTCPPTSRNTSSGRVNLHPRLPFLPKHWATKFSEFPEPQSSKFHSQCQESNLKDKSREGPSASARFPLLNNNNYNYNNNKRILVLSYMEKDRLFLS